MSASVFFTARLSFATFDAASFAISHERGESTQYIREVENVRSRKCGNKCNGTLLIFCYAYDIIVTGNPPYAS